MACLHSLDVRGRRLSIVRRHRSSPVLFGHVAIAALGIGSLGITAVSQLDTVWAVLAIAWGAAFIAAGEREASQATGIDRRSTLQAKA